MTFEPPLLRLSPSWQPNTETGLNNRNHPLIVTEPNSTQNPPRPEPAPERNEPPAALEGLRREIDDIDERIVDLLAQRYTRVQKVVAIKKAQRLPVYHPAREEDLIQTPRVSCSDARIRADLALA